MKELGILNHLDKIVVATFRDSKKAALYWQRYKRIDDSIIAGEHRNERDFCPESLVFLRTFILLVVDLFLGQLMSTLECMSCGHKSTTFDPFWDLSLPIPRVGSRLLSY